MEVDRSYLENTIANLRQQEANAIATQHQARGAIILAEALLARLDEKEPPLAPIVSMNGATSPGAESPGATP